MYEGQTSQVDISIIAQPFLGPRELLELFSLEKCKKIKVRVRLISQWTMLV